ncbi:MAG: flagellar basal body L-ring protein FlgH [Spirochaetes bacterium]|nr:flagellar basal body L-ring protein FlgH [Spirochaetota bacterium]HOD13688.1 flagellar basal body L-ring protein FlgH [Spirochaetota bacterium]
MKKAIITYLILVAFGCVLNAKTIWRDRNPYSSRDDLDVGSVVVVSINDVSDMRFTLSMSNKSTSQISVNPDMTITGFLPKIASDRKINHDDSTQFSGKGKFAFTVAARVTNRTGNMLNVAGSRTYSVNGVATVVNVTGMVDPALLKGRIIDSRNVANFSLTITGVKQGVAVTRPALKKDEQASANLTEEEKQKIIIDYLERMLGELTR